jgi:hypothetical protein
MNLLADFEFRGYVQKEDCISFFRFRSLPPTIHSG